VPTKDIKLNEKECIMFLYQWSKIVQTGITMTISDILYNARLGSMHIKRTAKFADC